MCLVPHSGNHGYIRNLRRSPSWELRTASPRGRYGERYTHATMLRGVQAIDIIPYGQTAWAAYPKILTCWVPELPDPG